MDKFKFDEKERDELYDLMGVLNHSKKIATLDRIETLISSRADGWVKVEDGLPEPVTDVLCYTPNGYGVECLYFAGDKRFYDLDAESTRTPTHWMKLPQPPKTAQQ